MGSNSSKDNSNESQSTPPISTSSTSNSEPSRKSTKVIRVEAKSGSQDAAALESSSGQPVLLSTPHKKPKTGDNVNEAPHPGSKQPQLPSHSSPQSTLPANAPKYNGNDGPESKSSNQIDRRRGDLHNEVDVDVDEEPPALAPLTKANNQSSSPSKQSHLVITPESQRKPVKIEAAGQNRSETIVQDVISKEESDHMLKVYALGIFKKADDDGDGFLNIDEFLILVQSPTLGLHISDEEARDMMQEYCDNLDEGVTFDQFIPIIKDLIMRQSLEKQEQHQTEGWQWFVMYFDEGTDLLPVYYNTIDDVMTYTKPPGVTEERELQAQNFENLTVDGVELTTFVNETGHRLYLNFDTGQWEFVSMSYQRFENSTVFRYFLPEWYEKIQLDEQGPNDSRRSVSQGDCLERCMHPVTGFEFESYLEDGCRYYFSEDVCEWMPIPIALEIYVPRIVDELGEIQSAFPTWRNKKEQLLALRQNKYDVEATIEWKAEELKFSAEFGDVPGEDFPSPTGASSSNIASTSAATSNVKSPNKASTQQHGSLSHSDERREPMKIKELKEEMALTIGQVEHRHGEEKLQWKQDLHQAQDQAQRLASRVSELEKNAAKDALEAARQAASLVEAHETRITLLNREIDSLRHGGDLKETLEERDRTIEGIRTKVKEHQQTLTTLRTILQLSCSRALFEVQTLRTKQVAIKQYIHETLLPTMQNLISDAEQGISKKMNIMVEEATKSLLARYRYEVQQRKLLYNKLQELKGNIRVFCRVRRDDRVKCILEFPDAKGLGLTTDTSRFLEQSRIIVGTPIEIAIPGTKESPDKKKYEFDRVYSPSSTQEDVFADTDAIMTSCVDGYNVCIMAYGQTGSGKTHTMMGTIENPGVNRRAVKELLRVCTERGETMEFSIKVSLMEIYNEKIVDLLINGSLEKVTCDIRQDPVTKLPFVQGLTQRQVNCVDDVVQTLADGDANRSVAATAMNSQSSRSHLLLQIAVFSKNTITGISSTGKLTLVDLAGSERVSKSEATGQRLVEAAAINKSLSALGQVFTALRVGQQHVPYRNSKLTHILQDSLGGDAKTCVFINVSPADSNLPETIGTLKFGQAIRTIDLKGGPKKAGPNKAAPTTAAPDEEESEEA